MEGTARDTADLTLKLTNGLNFGRTDIFKLFHFFIFAKPINMINMINKYNRSLSSVIVMSVKLRSINSGAVITQKERVPCPVLFSGRKF